MKFKRCILKIFAIFVFLLTILLISQRSTNENYQFEDLSQFQQASILQKSDDNSNAIKNRLRRRKLPISINFAKPKIINMAQARSDDDTSLYSGIDFSRIGIRSIIPDRTDRLPVTSDPVRDFILNGGHSTFKSILVGHSKLAPIGISNWQKAKMGKNTKREMARNSNQPIISSTVAVPPYTQIPHGTHPEATIITALFDIGRGNWTIYKRPYSLYQNYMKRLLALDVYLVVFADEEGARFVRKNREARMHKTKIQEISIQQLPLYAKHYGRVKDLIDREQSNWKPDWDPSMRSHPESSSAEYDILMNSKPYFVYYVANWNPFNTDYFYWLDAGYGHDHDIYPPAGSYWTPENLMQPDIGEKITFIVLGPGNITILTLKEFYRQGLTVVNGGFFGGGKRAIGDYYHLHNRIFEDLLNQDFVDDDQTLTVLCYQRNPALFNMVVGYWDDVFRLFTVAPDRGHIG